MNITEYVKTRAEWNLLHSLERYCSGRQQRKVSSGLVSRMIVRRELDHTQNTSVSERECTP